MLDLWRWLTAPPAGASPVVAFLTTTIVVAWVLSEVGVRLYAVLRGAPRSVPAGKDRGSWSVLMLCLVVLVGVTLFDHHAPLLGALSVPLIVIGEVLMGGGIALRLLSVGFLGRFFTTRVTIQPRHRLVTRGPYRWVRHPSYTGAVLTLLGFPLALGSGLGLLLAVPLIALGFGYRIRVEEEALAAAFGAEFQEYRGRTSRLLPGLY